MEGFIPSRSPITLEQSLAVANCSFEKVRERERERKMEPILARLEISDERTLRDDLIIREGSSPETRKGLLKAEDRAMNCFSFASLLCARWNG